GGAGWARSSPPRPSPASDAGAIWPPVIRPRSRAPPANRRIKLERSRPSVGSGRRSASVIGGTASGCSTSVRLTCGRPWPNWWRRVRIDDQTDRHRVGDGREGRRPVASWRRSAGYGRGATLGSSENGKGFVVVVVGGGLGLALVLGLSLGSPGNVPALISSMFLNPSPSESFCSMAP